MATVAVMTLQVVRTLLHVTTIQQQVATTDLVYKMMNVATVAVLILQVVPISRPATMILRQYVIMAVVNI